MGKFTKRLMKVNKNLRNVLVVGSAFGLFEELVEEVSTVFIVYPKDSSPRGKNLVYRESLDSIHVLYDIDSIILDKDSLHHLPELEQVWKKSSVSIVIEGGTEVSVEYWKFLKSRRFQIVDIHKRCHIWKLT